MDVGGHAVTKQAASTSQMGRFETEVLATNANVEALANLSGQWIDKVHDRHPPTKIILDMDSSVPDPRRPEGTLQRTLWMHLLPPSIPVQPVRRLERSSLRPGNVHPSADDWEGVLKPVVVRGRKVRLYFRGDAAFASPEIDYLEAEGCTRSASKPTRFSRKASAICSRDLLADRRTMCGAPITPASAIRLEVGTESGAWWPRWNGTPASWFPVRLHRHQPVAASRTGGGLLQSTRQGGAIHQGRQERDQMDAAVMQQVPRQRRSAAASRPGLNLANFMRTLALPKEVEHWSLTTLREKLVKIGAKVVRHGRYVTFQLAEVAVPRLVPENLEPD